MNFQAFVLSVLFGAFCISCGVVLWFCFFFFLFFLFFFLLERLKDEKLFWGRLLPLSPLILSIEI